MMKKAIYQTMLKFGLDVRRVNKRESNVPSEPLGDDFARLYEMCKPFTMTSRERMFAAYQAARFVVANKIEGDVVECGVWKGGSSMIIALAMLEMGSTARDFFLYDTYEGMSEPTEKDKNAHGELAIKTWGEHQTDQVNTWCYSPLEEVQDNFAGTRYPDSKLHFVKGKVEDSIPGTMPEKISLLRLDTDWFESTYHEMKHLFPRLSKGGILIIDDYGDWQGSQEAVDQYCREQGLHLLLNRIDTTGRLAVKV